MRSDLHAVQYRAGLHSADRELFLSFFNGVKAQIAQIDRGTYTAFSQSHPPHSSQNAVALILVQLSGFFQGLGTGIVLYGYHKQILLW